MIKRLWAAWWRRHRELVKRRKERAKRWYFPLERFMKTADEKQTKERK